MARQRVANAGAGAVDHVEHARREARFVDEFGEEAGRKAARSRWA